jgi:hypothetical protein
MIGFVGVLMMFSFMLSGWLYMDKTAKTWSTVAWMLVGGVLWLLTLGMAMAKYAEWLEMAA